MKGKLVTVEKSEINYVKKFSFRHILSSLHFNENIKRESRKTKAPDPLNSQYPNRRAREEAIEHQDKRRQKASVLFPPGKHIYIYV